MVAVACCLVLSGAANGVLAVVGSFALVLEAATGVAAVDDTGKG